MAAQARPSYVIDTSSWLSIERHPAQNRILSVMVPLIEGGRVKVPVAVWDEFQITSSLTLWMKPFKEQIVDRHEYAPGYFAAVGAVTRAFPAMAGATGVKQKADPWVVGFAKYGNDNGGQFVVVCDETLKNRPNRKIPTACAQYGLECKTLVEMLAYEFPADGWA